MACWRWTPAMGSPASLPCCKQDQQPPWPLAGVLAWKWLVTKGEHTAGTLGILFCQRSSFFCIFWHWRIHPWLVFCFCASRRASVQVQDLAIPSLTEKECTRVLYQEPDSLHGMPCWKLPGSLQGSVQLLAAQSCTAEPEPTRGQPCFTDDPPEGQARGYPRGWSILQACDVTSNLWVQLLKKSLLCIGDSPGRHVCSWVRTSSHCCPMYREKRSGPTRLGCRGLATYHHLLNYLFQDQLCVCLLPTVAGYRVELWV